MFQFEASLVNKFENAQRILKDGNFSISGRKLLETINFLCESSVVPATLHNILKSFTSDPEDFFKVQDEIIKALDILTEAKVLLDTNKTYRITSDIEQRLLDEMIGFAVQGFVKKKQVVAAYQTTSFIKTVSRILDNNLQYDFYITTDNDDELTNPSLKYLKLKLKSVYNISDDRTTDIESLKVQHQNDKDLVWLVPDNSSFKEIDKLIDEVERTTYLEQKYNNPNSEEGKILVSFSTAKAEKQNRIKDLIEQSLSNATAIYLYNTYQLSKDNWQTTLQNQQKQVISNVYSKRLSSQLAETVAAAVIKEANATRLHQYFQGVDFQFFDATGNFIGDNLKVAEETLYKIRNTFVDGTTLEKELEQPPSGFVYGTVISTVAALMRAGKLMAKYNGAEKFAWRDEGVTAIFLTAREFRKASFKAVSKSLSAIQKQEMAQFLLDVEVDRFIGRKIDYNTNDFDLVNAIRDVAKHLTDKVVTLRNTEKDFDKLFPAIDSQKDFIAQFTGAVSESNYIDKAVDFLSKKSEYLKAIQEIEKVEKFIRNNLPKLKDWKSFIVAVNDELTKAATSNTTIETITTEFNNQYQTDIVNSYAKLQQAAQKIKDEYHKLFSKSIADASVKYLELKKQAEALVAEINSLPAGLNEAAFAKANAILQYATQRTQSTIDIDFDVKDKNSRFTYSEVLSFIDLYNSKKTEIEIIKANLIKVAPVIPVPGSPVVETQTFLSKIPSNKIKVSAYRVWLQQELQKIAAANDNDEIEIKSEI